MDWFGIFGEWDLGEGLGSGEAEVCILQWNLLSLGDHCSLGWEGGSHAGRLKQV